MCSAQGSTMHAKMIQQSISRNFWNGFQIVQLFEKGPDADSKSFM